MGLASSMGLGIALVAPEASGGRARRRRLGADEPRHLHDAGALPAGESGPRGLRQREPALGGRLPHRDVDGQRPGRDRARRGRAAHGCTVAHAEALSRALASPGGTTDHIVAKVEAVGPSRTSRTWRCSRIASSSSGPGLHATTLTRLVEELAPAAARGRPDPAARPRDAGHRACRRCSRASPASPSTEISRYDEQGPAWYWNTLRLGEHTGTHFDAPVHWITGKDLPDNACDTIPPRRFVGPACVIDVEREMRGIPTFC